MAWIIVDNNSNEVYYYEGEQLSFGGRWSNYQQLEVSARTVSAIHTSSPVSSIVSNAFSVRDVRLSQLASAQDTLSARRQISATSAAIMSAINVVSAAVSGLAATPVQTETSNRTSADNALSQAISVVSQRLSVVQAQLPSVTSATTRSRVVASAQVISAATLTNVSGLSLSVSAGCVYELQALLLVNKPASTAIHRYGLTFPNMTRVRGKIYSPTSVLQGGIPTLSAIGELPIPFTGNSASGSVIVSALSMSRVSIHVEYYGVFKVNTGGTVQLQAAFSAGTGAGTIIDGSYLKLLKLG